MTLYRWVILLSAYVVILAVSAILAPVVCLSVVACDKFFAVGWLRYLAHKPLECYVDRLRVIVGCIVVLVAVRKAPKKYHWNLRRGFGSYAKTFLFGIFVWMALFFIIKGFVSDIEIKAIPNAGILLQAFIAGLLLATAEEVIFRGFLWDFVRNGRQTFEGVFPLALIFALLHFSHCDAGSDANLFIQSFQCAWHSITDIPQRFVLEFFLCVFLLSLLLCGLRMQTQTLWGAIGFHQGLITTLFVLRKCVRYPEVATSRFLGTGHLTDSWFVVLVLCCLCVWMFWRTKKQALVPRKTPQPAPSGENEKKKLCLLFKRICSGRWFIPPSAGVDKAVGWVYRGGKIDGHTVLRSDIDRFGSRLNGSYGKTNPVQKKFIKRRKNLQRFVEEDFRLKSNQPLLIK